MRGGIIALAVCYALLAHLAVETGSAPLTVACLALLAAIMLAPGIARRSPAACTLAIVVGAGLALAASYKWVWLPLYLPSVGSDAFMAWLFGHTLAAGRVPLIERMVHRLRDSSDAPVEPEVVRYARSLTLAWAMLFGALAAISLALALCAAPNGVLLLLGFTPPVTVGQPVWSWFANLAEYGIVAGFFVMEYAYRRRRFPRQPHLRFFDFVRRLAAIAPALIEREPRRAVRGARESAFGAREVSIAHEGSTARSARMKRAAE